MGNPVYIGIDIGKYMVSCSAPGRNVRDFEATPEGCSSLLAMCSELAPAEELFFVMEATGSYSSAFATMLLAEAAELRVAIVPPACVLGFIKSGIRKTKNDHADALAIRHFGEVMQPPAWMPRSETMQSMRDMKLVLDQVTGTVSRYKCTLEKLQNTGSLVGYEAMNALMKDAEAEKARILDEIDALIQSDSSLAADAELMQSISGVGRITCVTLLACCYAQIKTLSQRQLLAFCGLSPHEYQSGKQKGQTRMSKSGDGRIRRVLYMVAMQMIRKGGILHDYFHKLKAAKGPGKGKVAMVSVMRKALYLIQGVLKSGVPFDRERYMAAA